jgi:hypothetical protein
MVRKRFPAARTKKKASPRVGRPVGTKPLTGAHPRLIHGFLVQLVVKRSGGGAASKAAPQAASASMRPHKLFPAATKHEGPADDSTFH